MIWRMGSGSPDPSHGAVDVDEWNIESIEFLPTPSEAALPMPIHGTITTAAGSFTGLVQWDRTQSLSTDVLHGEEAGLERSLPFAAIRTLRPDGQELHVVLRSGDEVVLTGARGFGEQSRGAYVDDPRFGRVLVGWSAIERVELSGAGSAPGYATYAPGDVLVGEVLTASGDQLRGRIVFDLDESETTWTLDAPRGGIDYMIPFALISVIDASDEDEPTVTLWSGASVSLERAGDLGPANGGLLVFQTAGEGVDYISWSDVAVIRFEPTGSSSR